MFLPNSSFIQIIEDNGPNPSKEVVFSSSSCTSMPNAKADDDSRPEGQPLSALDFYIQNLMVSVNELSDEIPIHSDNCKVNHLRSNNKRSRRRRSGRSIRRSKSADDTESFAESANRPRNYGRQYSDSELCRSRWSSVSPTRFGTEKVDQAPCLRRRCPENDDEEAST